MTEKFLLKYIRYILLTIAVLFAVGVYAYHGLQYPGSQQMIAGMVKVYALTAITLLYISLLIGPFYDAFRHAPGRGVLTKARRSIGVSAFFFGLLHGSIAFFTQLGGFAGLSYLPASYIRPVLFGLTALIILAMMASTSFDYWVKRLGRRWKMIHRFVYLAGWLILFHAFALGSDFSSMDSLTARITVIAVSFLLILQALRIDKYVQTHGAAKPQYGSLFVILVATIISVAYSLLYFGEGSVSGLGIHSQHLGANNQNSQQITDTTKRFNVDYQRDGETVQFRITEAANGNPVTRFATPYEKPAHLIVANDKLDYFAHIHPELNDNLFTAKLTFPKNDTYRLYLDFEPVGGTEQQVAFIESIGTSSPTVQQFDDPTEADLATVKTVGEYELTLEKPAVLSANQLSVGGQQLTITVRRADTKEPVTNLQPYLASFGHLVMIAQNDYRYIHVHPLTAATAGSTGGPSVTFMPMGAYGSVAPGVYRIFVQLNPNGNLITADFTVKVEE